MDSEQSAIGDESSKQMKVDMSELAVSPEQASEVSGDRIDSVDDFVRAFNRVRAELVSTLYYVLRSHDDAQDVAQEAFMKCWRTRETLTDVKNARAWIFRVGLNAAKDLKRNAWKRKAKLLGDAPPPEPAGEASALETLEEKESQQHLQSALMDLRPEEKEVFLLRQNADLTYEEIAELRRLPVGTVKTQMRAALQKLKRVLQET